jgi:hypothetical protein
MTKYIFLLLLIASTEANAQFGPELDAMLADSDRSQIRAQNEEIKRQNNEILRNQREALMARRAAEDAFENNNNYQVKYNSALYLLDLIASGQCQYALAAASFHPITTQSSVRTLCAPKKRKR